MGQFKAEIFPTEVSFAEADERLSMMPDEELVRRLRPNMFYGHRRLNTRSWRPAEPEHESLTSELRAQARADLNTAYFGDTDYICDHHVAHAQTRPHPTLIFLSDLEGRNEDDEDDDEFEMTNPVVRLRALGICAANYVDFPVPETTPPLPVSGVQVDGRFTTQAARSLGDVIWPTTTTTGSWNNTHANLGNYQIIDDVNALYNIINAPQPINWDVLDGDDESGDT